MADADEMLARLDAYKSASVVAHERIYDLYGELVERGRADERASELLRLDARAAAIDLPRLVRRAGGAAPRPLD